MSHLLLRNALICIIVTYAWPLLAQVEFGTPKLITSVGGDGIITFSPTVSAGGREMYFAWESSTNLTEIHWATRTDENRPWFHEGPVPSLAFPSDNDRPALSPDGLTMIFGSDRGGGAGGWDLWMTERTDKSSPWQEPVNLESLNTGSDESAPTISGDGLSLFFSGGWWGIDESMKVASRASLQEDWSASQVVPGFESLALVDYPTVSADGLTMIYQKGKDPDADLWLAKRESIDSPFDSHSRLSDEINTDGVDGFPSLTLTGELYYVRGARIGNGGNNTWRLFQTGPEPTFDALDLNLDGRANVVDLDTMCFYAATERRRFPEAFDLTNDGRINSEDIEQFVQSLGVTPGDTDLDGDVNFADFTRLSELFGTEVKGGNWSHGDFNCDGKVEFDDFLNLSDNFGKTTAASVPEPRFNAMWCALLLVTSMVKSRRRAHLYRLEEIPFCRI